MQRTDGDSFQPGGPLPGYPVDSIPLHVPARIGVLARLYVARRKAAAVLAVAIAVGACVAAGGWVGAALIGRPVMPEDLKEAFPLQEEASGSIAGSQVEPGASADRAQEVLKEARTASAKVEELAGTDTPEEKLAAPSKDAAVARSQDKRDGEGEAAVRTIRSITEELETMSSNATFLSAQADGGQDVTAAETALAEIEKKAAELETFLGKQALDDVSVSLEVRIAENPSVFWRRSPDGGQQYFAIVEAFTDEGTPYAWEVRDMDTGSVSRLERWAVRITEEEYARIAAEKAMGRDLPDPVAGTKAEGSYGISWRIAVAGGELSSWEGDAR